MGLFKYIGEQLEKGREKERDRQRSHAAYHHALATTSSHTYMPGDSNERSQSIAERLADPTSSCDYDEQERRVEN